MTDDDWDASFQWYMDNVPAFRKLDTTMGELPGGSETIETLDDAVLLNYALAARHIDVSRAVLHDPLGGAIVGFHAWQDDIEAEVERRDCRGASATCIAPACRCHRQAEGA